MTLYFYINSLIAVVSAMMVILVRRPVHGLLYFVLSSIALAVSIYLLSAPFLAALEVTVYAGAIMVLFVFAVMVLNLTPDTSSLSIMRRLLGFTPGFVIAGLLLWELVLVMKNSPLASQAVPHSAVELATALWGRYGILVELASFLLLAGMVGAFHLGRKR